MSVPIKIEEFAPLEEVHENANLVEQTFVDANGQSHTVLYLDSHVGGWIEERETPLGTVRAQPDTNPSYYDFQKKSEKKYWTEEGPNLYKTLVPNFKPLKPNARDDYSRWARKPIDDTYREHVKTKDTQLIVMGCKAAYRYTNDVTHRLYNSNEVDTSPNAGIKIWRKNKRSSYAHSRLPFLYGNSTSSPSTDELNEHQIPIIHLFCLDTEGRSVCVNVHGFFPYVYTDIDDDLYSDENELDEIGDALCEKFALAIEAWASTLKKRFKKKEFDKKRGPKQDWSNDDEDPFESNDGWSYSSSSKRGKSDSYGLFADEENGDDDQPKRKGWYNKNEPKMVTHSHVVNVKIVKKIPLDGAHKGVTPMFQVKFSTPSHIGLFRKRFMDEGFPISWEDKDIILGGPGKFERGTNIPKPSLTYDSCIRFENRFLIDTKLHGGCWFNIKKESQKQIRFYEDDMDIYEEKYHWKEFSQCLSRCQTEIDIHYSDIKACDQYAPENNNMYSNPVVGVRILSFDIECIGRNCRFPDPKKDPLVTINVYATKDSRYPTIFSSKEEDYTKDPTKLHERDKVISVCFSVSSSEFERNSPQKKVLRGYSDPNPTVYSFKDEKQMLTAFCQFINVFDPDIITGYNSSIFDIPQIVQRCQILGIEEALYCSRLLSEPFTYKEEKKEHEKNGSVVYTIQECVGRLTWDVLPFVRADVTKKYPSYSLNYVANAEFKETKDDINHHTLPIYYRSGAKFRDVVRLYCERDAFLALRLFLVYKIWESRLEASRVAGIRLEQEESDGSAAKAFPHITRCANADNFVMPWRHYTDRGEKYEGAIVQNPDLGFHYKYLIMAFDYVSEYPATIRAWNICMSTYVSPERWPEIEKKYGPDCCNICPFLGHRFLKKEYREGILPKVETFLMERRTFVKNLMGAMLEGSAEMRVADCRQTQLKLKANGLYGVTGVVNNGFFWKIPVAESVTAWARDQINRTVEILHTERKDCHIIYGDTDSVIVYFDEFPFDKKSPAEVQLDTTKRFHAECCRLAKVITSKMKHPNELKAEFIFFPMLLVSRKKYAMMLREKPTDKPKQKAKGIECERRSTCLFTSITQTECLRILLQEIDIEKAFEYALERTRHLATYNFNFSELVVSTRLNKIPEFERDAGTVRPQEYLYQRMKEHDPNAVPNLGDRIPYLIRVGDSKKQKNFSKAIHPTELAGKNAQQIDIEYYFEKQFLRALSTLFKYIERPNGLTYMGNKKKTNACLDTIMNFKMTLRKSELANEEVDETESEEVTERKLDFEARLRKEFKSHMKICTTNNIYWTESDKETMKKIDEMIGITANTKASSTPSSTSSTPTKSEDAERGTSFVEGLDEHVDEPMFMFPKNTTNLADSTITTYGTQDLRSFSKRLKTCLRCLATMDAISSAREAPLITACRSSREAQDISYSLCISCFNEAMEAKFGTTYTHLRNETTVDFHKPSKPVEEKKKRGKKRKQPDNKPQEDTKKPTKQRKKIGNEPAPKTPSITAFFQKVDQSPASLVGAKRKHVSIEFDKSNKAPEEPNLKKVKLEPERKDGNSKLKEDGLVLLETIRKELASQMEESQRIAEKKWQTCKSCMGAKFEKDACSNYECYTWFQRSDATSKLVTHYKQLSDFTF
jgi:DNA polymerase elongation subunit (family B)